MAEAAAEKAKGWRPKFRPPLGSGSIADWLNWGLTEGAQVVTDALRDRYKQEIPAADGWNIDDLPPPPPPPKTWPWTDPSVFTPPPTPPPPPEHIGLLAKLGLGPNASLQDAEKAYRQLAKQAHPDRPGGSVERMTELNQAISRLRVINSW